MSNNLLNTITTKIKENETMLEYGLILTIESSLAVLVIYNMFNVLLSILS